MKIVCIGHLSRDVNVIGGASRLQFGGGVFHNAMTARALGAEAVVRTRCAPEHEGELTATLREAGVTVRVRHSPTSTSIENVYPNANPDHRISRLLSGGGVFEAADLLDAEADVIHVNPLWFGEFPVDLLPLVRPRAKRLGADAQGFLRNVEPDGRLAHHDWAEKARWLPLFDVFKADLAEARVLTGETEVRPAAAALHALGPREIVLTHAAGLCVYDGSAFHEAEFGPYPLEGRTGRGDTCSAAYLVARADRSPAEAARVAAAVTARKLQYPGPFRG